MRRFSHGEELRRYWPEVLLDLFWNRQASWMMLRWSVRFAGLTDARLAELIGPEERHFEGQPLVSLIFHVNREVLSHIAEVALLRDLYARQPSA
jgi:hypothetical protein